MELTAQTRTSFGKKSKNLKYEQKIPAVIFGKGIPSVAISIDLMKFSKAYKEAGETTLVTLNLDNGTEKVLIKDVQFGPVSSKPIHVGFYKVNLKEKISANIPVHVTGEDKNEAIKSGNGLVLMLLSEIAVEALPTDLPHSFNVDVSNLELGQGVAVNQLSYDKNKVEVLGVEPEELILKIGTAQMIEEVEEAVDEASAIAGIEATEEVVKEEGAEEAGAGSTEKTEKSEKDKEADRGGKE